jgi:hypothetical protein
MTNWGLGLLCVFVGLGVGPISTRKAMRLAVAVASAVLVAVFASYHALR